MKNAKFYVALAGAVLAILTDSDIVAVLTALGVWGVPNKAA